jgi:DNA-binding MarR family transcriptional regulator
VGQRSRARLGTPAYLHAKLPPYSQTSTFQGGCVPGRPRSIAWPRGFGPSLLDGPRVILAVVGDSLPLSTLLSHVLVAFTVEFDNESERQLEHGTTRHGSTMGSLRAPWLVSLVMWSNCMRFLDDAKGITVAELERRARTSTNLAGMQRWGYIVVGTGSAASRGKRPRTDAVVRPTPAGRKAEQVWRPLFAVIEDRRRKRLGQKEIDRLRESLCGVASQLSVELPDCLPILQYGLFSRRPEKDRPEPTEPGGETLSRLPLPALLSKVLLAFAMEFERESELSLAISANLLRVLDQAAVRVQDLPPRTGVSKESIRMALGILLKKGLMVIEPRPSGSRAKLARLTAKGQQAKDAYGRLLDAVEQRWLSRFGESPIRSLRNSLEPLVGEPRSQSSPLFQGLEPFPHGGEPRFRGPTPCRIIRWCCIAAGSRMG